VTVYIVLRNGKVEGVFRQHDRAARFAAMFNGLGRIIERDLQ
jgi:hypothetical protein